MRVVTEVVQVLDVERRDGNLVGAVRGGRRVVLRRVRAAGEAGRLAGTVNVAGTPDPSNPGDFLFENWIDVDNSGTVTAADELNISYRRRTVEMGTRSEDYNSELFQAIVGLRGDISENWSYDASFQYGESNRVLLRAGYTNLTNVGNALRTTDGVTCENGA